MHSHTIPVIYTNRTIWNYYELGYCHCHVLFWNRSTKEVLITLHEGISWVHLEQSNLLSIMNTWAFFDVSPSFPFTLHVKVAFCFASNWRTEWTPSEFFLVVTPSEICLLSFSHLCTETTHQIAFFSDIACTYINRRTR